MTRIIYDAKLKVLQIVLSDEQAIADETIEDNLNLGWASNGKLVDVSIMDADPPVVEWM